MGLATLAERLASCRAEIAACDPDLGPTAVEFAPAKDVSGTRATSGRRASNQDFQAGGQQDFQAIKKRISKEEELHVRLQKELTQAYAHVKRLHERCLADLEEVPAGIELDCTDTSDLEGIDAGGAAELARSKQRACAAEASAATEEASRLRRSIEGRAARRRELEAELRLVRERQLADQRRHRICLKDEGREADLRAASEHMLQAQGTLGFPSLEFDDARGVVVLGPPVGAGPASTGRVVEAIRTLVPESVRTVALSYHAGGRLASVEAHPCLQLQREAAAAVAQDDLGRLLTAVWAQILRAAEKATGAA